MDIWKSSDIMKISKKKSPPEKEAFMDILYEDARILV